MRTIDGEEGGLVRTPRDGNLKRRFCPRRRETRNVFKTGADFAAEHIEALQRWTGVPPLTAAREMIAEANLAPELLGRVLKAISEMPEEQLAEFVNFGGLSRQLAELTAN